MTTLRYYMLLAALFTLWLEVWNTDTALRNEARLIRELLQQQHINGMLTNTELMQIRWALTGRGTGG